MAGAHLYIESQDHPDASIIDIALAIAAGTLDSASCSTRCRVLLIAILFRRFFREVATRLRAEPGPAAATAGIL